MTKSLEEEFNLPSIEEVKIPDEEQSTDRDPADIQNEILVIQKDMEIADRVDGALPMVQGLEQLDREMDEYASKAMATFEDLCDLGKNVEDRHAAPIFDSASKMLTAALQAKQTKLDKKLKMIELQMRKAKLDLDTRRVDASLSDKEEVTEEIEGRFIGNRSSMLAEIMAKMKETDK
jgi:hypothetical protein